MDIDIICRYEYIVLLREYTLNHVGIPRIDSLAKPDFAPLGWPLVLGFCLILVGRDSMGSYLSFGIDLVCIGV